jgi:hypothetical protein
MLHLDMVISLSKSVRYVESTTDMGSINELRHALLLLLLDVAYLFSDVLNTVPAAPTTSHDYNIEDMYYKTRTTRYICVHTYVCIYVLYVCVNLYYKTRYKPWTGESCGRGDRLPYPKGK